LLLAATFIAASARAAEWVERPFDPAIGSHWLIQSSQVIQDNTESHGQSSTTTSTAEMTIEQKTADGFRVTYVVHDSTYDGDPSRKAIVEAATKFLDGLVIHATIAANGTPLRIDNLGEVVTTGQTAIDRMADSLADKPEVVTAMRRVASGMLTADPQQAPKIYLASLSALAVGQNTGLRPGAPRSDTEDVPNPLNGSPIKANSTLSIAGADPATGNVRYIRTRAFDPDAIKDFLAKTVQHFGSGTDNANQKFSDFIKQIGVTLDSRTEIAVAGGMTRDIREDDTATASIGDRTIVKRVHRELTVKPAP
jgi:hypothetical protein